MPDLRPAKSGLDIGFDAEPMPVRYGILKGNVWRSINAAREIPFEDAQFEVVVLNGRLITLAMAKEIHRVLRPEGRLYFTVAEKNSAQDGLTLPEIYATLREGYNIVDVQPPKWWHIFSKGRTISICAQKKNWRFHTNVYRPLTAI